MKVTILGKYSPNLVAFMFNSLQHPKMVAYNPNLVAFRPKMVALNPKKVIFRPNLVAFGLIIH